MKNSLKRKWNTIQSKKGRRGKEESQDHVLPHLPFLSLEFLSLFLFLPIFSHFNVFLGDEGGNNTAREEEGKREEENHNRSKGGTQMMMMMTADEGRQKKCQKQEKCNEGKKPLVVTK